MRVLIWDKESKDWVTHAVDVWNVKLIAEGKEELYLADHSKEEIHVYPVVKLEDLS